ncbi:hypothetical protein CKR_2467 [Clostridium kluyveri NBRC 12016]|uniref:Uncharacterized protein n=2 Tax=Clostridium kluyveri TaxID=1534 RepID=A5N0Z2_CLOK5|nr:Hypothetical protein CKL_2776 [Clostridium kluyveri DSM 555]BAH07518.1 hypothetical protein CKR_2467 [Clostridium kluyveri NBRC 12016]
MYYLIICKYKLSNFNTDIYKLNVLSLYHSIYSLYIYFMIQSLLKNYHYISIYFVILLIIICIIYHIIINIHIYKINKYKLMNLSLEYICLLFFLFSLINILIFISIYKKYYKIFFIASYIKRKYKYFIEYINCEVLLT